MRNFETTLRRGGGIFLAGLALACGSAVAQDNRFELDLEVGPTWQSKNDVQIPNDKEGTRFSLKDLAGEGPWAGVRLSGIWNINEKHGMRLLLAPLSYTENGTLDRETRFAGETYQPNERTKASYTFNSWRLGYRYQFYDKGPWDLWVGGTAKIRDAEIKLEQGSVSSKDDNVGVVPLLYLAANYQINDRWSLAADFDGLAGGPGRAIDLGIRVNYQVADRWKLGLGYRLLEGGVDSDDVYNFAWFNSLMFSANYRF